MVTNQLKVTFDGPGISEGVPLADLNKTLTHVQNAMRLMVENLAGVEHKPGRPSKWIRAQSSLMLRGTSPGSLVVELELSKERERYLEQDYGLKSLDAILNWQPDDDQSLPDEVDAELKSIGKGISLGINLVMLGDHYNPRRVTIPRIDSGQIPVSLASRTEEAIVHGYLMEIDWARNTARLDPRASKPIRLRFDADFHNEMRHLSTKFVKITGKGNLNKDDEWTSITVDTIEGDRHWSQPFDMSDISKSPKIFRSADGLLIDDPFESDQDLQEFIRVIHEGRDI